MKFIMDLCFNVQSQKRIYYLGSVLKMSTELLIFLLLFGLKNVTCLRGCPSLSPPHHGRLTCIWENKKVPCGSFLSTGSVVQFNCEQFYKLSPGSERFLKCQTNGSWSSASPKCVPDCGLRSEFGALVANGAIASPKDFPWHVGMYNFVDGKYEYWCGGNLISESIVITAAHCTWEVSPSNLSLVLGKFHRDYNILENASQKVKVRKIEMPSSYQDATGNYNGDIAVIFLERDVMLGAYSAPICIDWDQRLSNEHLIDGALVTAVGWGLTENETLSDVLRTVTIPVIPNEECIEKEAWDFKKFITFTSFCAGFKNGTGVCNGDSGGGLVFFDDVSQRWYLLGLVSVSPRKRGTPYCDLGFYTIFTKLSIFSKWLIKVIEIEKKLSPFRPFDLLVRKSARSYYNFFARNYDKAWMKNITHPHSMKMLELVGQSKRELN